MKIKKEIKAICKGLVELKDKILTLSTRLTIVSATNANLINRIATITPTLEIQVEHITNHEKKIKELGDIVSNYLRKDAECIHEKEISNILNKIETIKDSIDIRSNKTIDKFNNMYSIITTQNTSIQNLLNRIVVLESKLQIS